MFKRTRRHPEDVRGGPAWASLDDLLGGDAPRSEPTPVRSRPAETAPAEPAVAWDDVATWDQAVEHLEWLTARSMIDSRNLQRARARAARVARLEAAAAARRHVDRERGRADDEAAALRAAARSDVSDAFRAGARTQVELRAVLDRLDQVAASLRERSERIDGPRPDPSARADGGVEGTMR